MEDHRSRRQWRRRRRRRRGGGLTSFTLCRSRLRIPALSATSGTMSRSTSPIARLNAASYTDCAMVTILTVGSSRLSVSIVTVGLGVHQLIGNSKPHRLPSSRAAITFQIVAIDALPEGGVIPICALAAPTEPVEQQQQQRVQASCGSRHSIDDGATAAAAAAGAFHMEWCAQAAASGGSGWAVERSVVQRTNGCLSGLCVCRQRQPGGADGEGRVHPGE